MSLTKRTMIVALLASGFIGCKTTSNRNTGGEFFNARDQAENPNASSIQWRYKWILDNSFRTTSELPVLMENEACEIMNVMIELPAISQEFEVGHTGVALGNDYFDYGPVKSIEKSRAILRAEGGPYWDNPASWPGAQSTEDVNWQMIQDTISSLADQHTVLVIPILIQKTHAEAMRQWWKKTYSTAPEYNIPGMHCTSSVIRSIEESDRNRAIEKNVLDHRLMLSSSSVTSPLKYAQTLLGNTAINTGRINTKHSCGHLYGKPVRAAVINVGPDLGAEGSKLLIKTSAGQ